MIENIETEEIITLKKTKECIHCEKMFECLGKPANVDQCINFKERKQR